MAKQSSSGKQTARTDARRTGSWTLLCAKRAGKMVDRVSDIGAVLRVKRDLEKVRKAAAVTAGAACTIRANRPRMNYMVARNPIA